MITIVDLREGALDVDRNKLGTYSHIGGSGKKITKRFCKNCAAPIITNVEKWGKDYLYAGLLDDISFIKKAKNIWYEKSHFAFLEIKENGVKI